MPGLRELQRDFLAAVLDGAAAPHALADARGLPVHRNNALANRVGALRAGYPVVERLVGPDFFGFMARAYADSHPSRSANLEEYGRDFADFVAGFGPAASLGYLADVARLEAAIDALLVAPDVDAAPGALPPALDELLFARVRLDPAALLFTSPYPVHRIWLSNQPGADESEVVSLDEPGSRVLLRRDGFEIAIETLDESEFASLSAVAASGFLSNALTAARGADGVCSAVLARRCAQGLFRILSPASEHKDPLP